MIHAAMSMVIATLYGSQVWCVSVIFLACALMVRMVPKPFSIWHANMYALTYLTLYLVSYAHAGPWIASVLFAFAGAIFGLAVLLLDMFQPSRKTHTQFWLLLLFGAAVAYFSGSGGSANGWQQWIQDHWHLSLSQADLAVQIIRKSIHFCYYGLIATLMCTWLKRNEVDRVFAGRLAIMWVFFHACFDELRQSFQRDRTGSVYDVGIDLLGAIAFLYLFNRSKKIGV